MAKLFTELMASLNLNMFLMMALSGSL